jgi:single-strand DNA-binding protein
MNRVTLIGNVGKDPIVQYVGADQAVATFTLATTERSYTLQNGTVVPERTEWHNIVLWYNLAKIAEKYVHKGERLYIEGKLRTRSYDDKQGVKKYVTEVYAENMEILTPKSRLPIGDSYHTSNDSQKSSSTESSQNHVNSDEVPF